MRFPLGVLRAILLVLSLGTTALEAAGPTRLNSCTTIVSSGSYILDRDLTAAGDCLLIHAHYVTVDLAGFTISGNGTGRGIYDGGVSRRGIAIRNGTITSFQTGVVLAFSRSNVVESLRILFSLEDGLQVGGQSIVRNNLVNENGRDGIVHTGGGTTIVDNVVTDNGRDGILDPGDSLISGNTVSTSRNGIAAAFGGTINGSTITGNMVLAGGGDGIRVNQGTVSGNTVIGLGSGTGIYVVCPSAVIGNTARGYETNLVVVGAGCNTDHTVAP